MARGTFEEGPTAHRQPIEVVDPIDGADLWCPPSERDDLMRAVATACRGPIYLRRAEFLAAGATPVVRENILERADRVTRMLRSRG